MAVDAAALRTEVGGTTTTVPDALANNCITVADALLKQYAGDDYKTEIPLVVAEKAWLSVAVELFNQRKAPNGVLNQAFANPEGGVATPIRIGADPLRPAYGLLSRWVIDVGFA